MCKCKHSLTAIDRGLRVCYTFPKKRWETGKMRKLLKYCPVWAFVAILLSAVSFLVLCLCRSFASVADFFSTVIGNPLRIVLSYLSTLFPFSIFEILLLLAIPVAVALTVLCVKYNSTAATRLRGVAALLGAVALLYSSHVFTLGAGYHTTPLSVRMELENKSSVTRDELYSAAVVLRSYVNEFAPEPSFDSGASSSPYSLERICELVLEGYARMNEDYSLTPDFSSRVKPVKYSGVMAQMGITGIYSYFTGEANISLAYPDYTLPFTVAHELAHQRGIARENEANFVAFLAASYSSDSYVRYSGYLNMYEYVVYALYPLDREAYYELNEGLSPVALADMAKASEVSRKYKDSFLNKLMDRVNDSYLKVNGTEGIVSYNNTVRLAVAYIEASE